VSSKFAASANRRFEFQKGAEFVVWQNNESATISRVCVCGEKHATTRINLRWTAPTPTGFAELFRYGLPTLHAANPSYRRILFFKRYLREQRLHRAQRCGEAPLWRAVLIHKPPAGLSPRLIPSSRQSLSNSAPESPLIAAQRTIRPWCHRRFLRKLGRNLRDLLWGFVQP